jgi:rubrerythrin
MPIELSIPGFSAKKFNELTEQEILALAISSEEEDSGIYAAYANKLRSTYPASAAVFDEMAAEENQHRRRLIDLYQKRFGSFIIPLRRENVSGYYARNPVWLIENLGLERVRNKSTHKAKLTTTPLPRAGPPTPMHSFGILAAA